MRLILLIVGCLVPGVLLESDVVDVISDDAFRSSTEAPREVFGFIHGFLASLSMICVSEIGDKTFFIAAIMSMKHSRLTVFCGAISALGLMTILSVFFGWIAKIVPSSYTFYISTFLFIVFGIKMIRDGMKMSPNGAQQEYEEVQSDLRKRDEEFEEAEKPIEQEKLSESPPPTLENKLEDVNASSDVESGNGASKKKPNNSLFKTSRVIFQAFSLTFLAEWGDRSQLATIVLAARENVYGVTIGGIVGHTICTGAAVIGGRIISQKISVKTVTIAGGMVFLIFALSAIFFEPFFNK